MKKTLTIIGAAGMLSLVSGGKAVHGSASFTSYTCTHVAGDLSSRLVVSNDLQEDQLESAGYTCTGD